METQNETEKNNRTDLGIVRISKYILGTKISNSDRVKTAVAIPVPRRPVGRRPAELQGTHSTVYHGPAPPAGPRAPANPLAPSPSHRTHRPRARDVGPPRRDASTAAPPPASLASLALGGWFHHGVNAGERSLLHLGGRGSRRKAASVWVGTGSWTPGHPGGLRGGPSGRSQSPSSLRASGRGERQREEGRGGASRSLEAGTSRPGS